MNTTDKVKPDDSENIEPEVKKRKTNHTQLKRVDISNKKLHTFETITDVESVIYINASKNYFTSITEQQLIFPNLTILIFTANDLESLPSLKFVPNLLELHLASNKIKEISNELQHVKKLRVLDLKRNHIEKIENLEHVKDSLEWLSLSGNKITSIKGLESLQKLQFLGLFGNLIRDLNETLEILKNLPQLSNLWIHGNPIYPISFTPKKDVEEKFKLHLKYLNGHEI